jgi:hypothetical protein
MIPMLIVTHAETNQRDIDAEHVEMRELQGTFYFQVVDSQAEDQVYASNSGFTTYDDARTAGVQVLGKVLDAQ